MSLIAASGDWVIAVEYDPTGLEWAGMRDFSVLGWVLNETGQASEPAPVIVGLLPQRAPDVAPIQSPQWAWGRQGMSAVIVPDLWRGEVEGFYVWLATNNGASRELSADFLMPDLHDSFVRWQNRR